MLLDYAMTRFELQPQVIAGLHHHPPQHLLQTLHERVLVTHNIDIERRAYEICAHVLGAQAEPWIRERWMHSHLGILFALAQASAACLPLDEGIQRVMDALATLPLKEKRQRCVALGWFRSSRVLEWLEQHVESPILSEWGQTAALSQIAWPWVVRWLDQGRPMSLVALDALMNCCRYTTRMLEQFAPHLQEPASFLTMKRQLEAYAAIDPVPRVEQSVQTIVRFWEAEDSSGQRPAP
jgi:hypothetical protein